MPADAKAKDGSDVQKSRETTVSDLGPLKAKERQDLNCAVKEYLLLAGYCLTAMTFYEEVCAAVVNFYFATTLFHGTYEISILHVERVNHIIFLDSFAPYMSCE